MIRAVCLAAAVACLVTAVLHGAGADVGPGESFPDTFWDAVSLPHTRIVLSSKLNENIVAVNAQEGQPVRKGDVLVEFDSRQMKARVAIAEATADYEARIKGAQTRYEYLRGEFDRCVVLGRFSSDAEKAKAQYEMDMAETDVAELRRQEALADRQLELAKAQSADYAVLSPVDGVVSYVWAKAGEMAQQGQQLLEVIDPKVIEVRVHLPEEHAMKVAGGQRAVVRFEAAGALEATGQVSAVTPYLDSSSRKFMVKVLVEPASGVVKAGMGCRVRFPSAS
jgi:RND family efflux transporter MFP subunit